MTKDSRIPIILAALFIFNFILIFFSYTEGLDKDLPTVYFEERQAVTFFSALFLAGTGLTALIIAWFHRRLDPVRPFFNFWFLSGLGFFYLAMDDYFMGHEGIDSAVLSLFGLNPDNYQFDGLVIGTFGLIAAGVCWYFRKEILRYKTFLLFICLGALGLGGTVLFDQLETVVGHHKGVVIEESFKVIGVTFFFSAYQTALFDFFKRLPLPVKTS